MRVPAEGPRGNHSPQVPTGSYRCAKSWLVFRVNKKTSLCPGCIASCISLEEIGLGYAFHKSGRKTPLCSQLIEFFFSLRNASHCASTPTATGRFLRELELLSRLTASFLLKSIAVLQFRVGRV